MGGERSRAGKAQRRQPIRHWLAIGLLLLQAFATAGHFHPEDFAFVAGGHGVDVVRAGGGQSGPAWPGGAPGLPAHDDCALCFSLGVANASALPPPIGFPTPSETRRATPLLVTALRLRSANHLLFQTRAPPIS